MSMLLAMSSNLDMIEAVYAAMAAGDVSALFELIDQDCAGPACPCERTSA
jgi:hypothetical protein